MSEAEYKPLRWSAEPGIGYTVTRRPDGGMNITFSDASQATLEHWRAFALDHLLDSDRLTRNLYDLRQLETLPEKAIQYAVEVNNDPSVRNIRLAVVATSPSMRKDLVKIAALTRPGGVEMAVFSEMEEAEAWLNRPLTQLV